MILVVAGGSGFIGSNFIRFMLDANPDVRIVNIDALTYAGNPANLEGITAGDRYTFVHADIAEPEGYRQHLADAEAVVNFAAESHVDRSIDHDSPFIRTNIVGLHALLSAVREVSRPIRFIQISTDEVYGTLPWRDPALGESAPKFTEDTPLDPRSPYSASKAGGDHLCAAYHHTHGMDVIITRASNNYGPYQLPEKLIPVMIANGLAGRSLPIYGDGLHVRDWIHVLDHCRGVAAALASGRAGAVYNFGGDAERTNLQVAQSVLRILGLPEDRIEHVADRPGHDRRYAMDFARAVQDLGWKPSVDFESGLRETVQWYLDNDAWLERTREVAFTRRGTPTNGS